MPHGPRWRAGACRCHCCVRLLGSRTTKERGAVDDGIDTAHGRAERIGIEQIAHGELDTVAEQVGGTRPIADQGTDVIAALGKALGESATDFSGRSGDEDFHLRNVVIGTLRGLEETDIGVRSLRDGARPITIER